MYLRVAHVKARDSMAVFWKDVKAGSPPPLFQPPAPGKVRRAGKPIRGSIHFFWRLDAAHLPRKEGPPGWRRETSGSARIGPHVDALGEGKGLAVAVVARPAALRTRACQARGQFRHG